MGLCDSNILVDAIYKEKALIQRENYGGTSQNKWPDINVNLKSDMTARNK